MGEMFDPGRRRFLKAGLAAVVGATAGSMGMAYLLRDKPPTPDEIEESSRFLRAYPVKYPLKPGVRVPDFEAATLPRTDEGRMGVSKNIRLSGLDGIVLLDFGIPGCGPCAEMDRELEKLYAKAQGDVTIIKIIPGTKPDGLSDYLRKNTFLYPVVYDEGGIITASYGVDVFPRVYVVRGMVLFGPESSEWVATLGRK